MSNKPETEATLTNKQKYDHAFTSSFSIEESQLNEKVAYNELPAWDSIGHMSLVAALEEAFNIAMETDDIMNLSSYTKGFEILKKYGIQF